MSVLTAETQEELEALLDAGWKFSGADRRVDGGGWTGSCAGVTDVERYTLELAVRRAYEIWRKP